MENWKEPGQFFFRALAKMCYFRYPILDTNDLFEVFNISFQFVLTLGNYPKHRFAFMLYLYFIQKLCYAIPKTIYILNLIRALCINLL